jgi:hypothetical protein
MSSACMAERLTESQGCNSVNNIERDDSVNQPVRPQLSEQQRRIMRAAARPGGVSAHEAVIEIGEARIQTRKRSGCLNGGGAPIVGTAAARSVAASVSRSLSRLRSLGLSELRQHGSHRDADGRLVRHQWRYHARIDVEAAP